MAEGLGSEANLLGSCRTVGEAWSLGLPTDSTAPHLSLCSTCLCLMPPAPAVDWSYCSEAVSSLVCPEGQGKAEQCAEPGKFWLKVLAAPKPAGDLPASEAGEAGSLSGHTVT